MATDIYGTLDALLAKYFDNRENSTTPAEKATSKSLYDKLCKKNGINGDSYLRNSRLNPSNQKNSRPQQKTRPTQQPKKDNYGNTSYNNSWDDEWDAETWFDFIFRRAQEKKKQEEYQRSQRDNNDHGYDSTRYSDYQRSKADRQSREREADRQRREREAKAEADKREAERKKQQEEKKKARWEEQSYTYIFHMTEPMLTEVGVDLRGERYVKFSGLAKRPHETRAPIQNFIIYSPVFDPKKWFEYKDVTFRVETGRAFYYRDHLVVHSLWMNKGGIEYEIKLDRIGG